ncbi:hypothetical protein Plhal304r1_c067g0155451 [Plasmopara halstedii]
MPISPNYAVSLNYVHVKGSLLEKGITEAELVGAHFRREDNMVALADARVFIRDQSKIVT